MSAPRLFIWVQHLFGKGHVRRMARVARACTEEGMAVTVAAGGPEGADAFEGTGADARQLPELRTRDAAYSGLVTRAGSRPDERFWSLRLTQLIGLMEEVQPDIIMTELFPFGRRKFAREVLPLLHAARAHRPRPLIVASVRDIVEPKTDLAKAGEMADWLTEHYDAVLCHGDDSIIRLSASAPYITDVPAKLHYTGYVAPRGVTLHPKRGVVVSAGSGPSGAGLLKVAAEVGDVSASTASPWTIFVPPGIEPPVTRNPDLTVEPFSSRFAGALARAEISISEAGYNTPLEALAMGAKSVLCPYEEEGQTEQATRAEALAARKLAVHLPAARLDTYRLIEAIEMARHLPPPRGLNLEGAKHTAVILNRLHSARSAS